MGKKYNKFKYLEPAKNYRNVENESFSIKLKTEQIRCGKLVL